MGLGIAWVASPMRTPIPPQKITTFKACSSSRPDERPDPRFLWRHSSLASRGLSERAVSIGEATISARGIGPPTSHPTPSVCQMKLDLLVRFQGTTTIASGRLFYLLWPVRDVCSGHDETVQTGCG